MSDVTLDRLVVRIEADTGPLRKQLHEAEHHVKQSSNVFEKNLSTSFDRGFERLGKSLASLSDQRTDVFDQLNTVADATERSVTRSALHHSVLAPMNQGLEGVIGGSLSRTLSGFAGQLLGGVFGRAAGGTVNPRSAYPVGEHGPELFVPHTHGQIIPKNLGQARENGRRSPTVNVHMTIQTPNPDGFRQTQKQMIQRALTSAHFHI